MSRSRRLAGAFVVAALLGVAAMMGQEPAGAGVPAALSARIPAATAAPPTAVDNLSACMVQRKHASILLLLDQSPSLGGPDDPGGTDPTFVRATAAADLVRRLAEVSARSGISIRIGVAGFSAGEQLAQPFTPAKSTESVILDAVSTVGHVHDGFETDYWSALSGASDQLRAEAAAQTAQTGSAPCEALILFTDGQYSLSVRQPSDVAKYGDTKPYAPGLNLTSAAAPALAAGLGATSICRPGGIADQIRSSGITTLAVGLGSSTSKVSDFDFLKQIATGYGSKDCGKVVSPPPGDFFPAADVNSLLLAFDALGGLPQRPEKVESGQLCQGTTTCASSTFRFTLDGSIQRIHVIATADIPNSRSPVAYLSTPAATTTPLKLTYPSSASTATLSSGGLAVVVTWLNSQTFTFDVVDPPSGAGWAGPWTLRLVDPTSRSPKAFAQTQLTIYGDLAQQLVAPQPASVEIDKGAVLTYGVSRTSGATVGAGTLPTRTTLDVSLVSPDGSQRVIKTGLRATNGRFTVPFPARTADQVGTAELLSVLHVTTNGGIHLVDTVRTDPLSLTPPPNTPKVTTTRAPGSPRVPGAMIPTAVSFGQTDATRPVAGFLTVTGPGCVWLDPSKTVVTGAPDGITFPDGSTAAALVSPYESSGTCLHLGKGEAHLFPLSLHLRGRGHGAFTAKMTIDTLASDRPTALPVTVTASASVVNSVDKVVRAWALLLALVFGLGFPLAAYVLIRRLTARFELRRLQAFSGSLRVDPAGAVTPASGGHIFDTSRPTMVPAENGRARAVTIGGVDFVAHPTLRPTIPGYGTATAPDAVVAAAGPQLRDRRGQARTALSLPGVWVVRASPAALEAGGDIDVQAVLILGYGGDVAGLVAAAEQRIVRDMPALVASMRTASGSPAQSAQPGSGPVPRGGGDAPLPQPGSGPVPRGRGDAPLPPSAARPTGGGEPGRPWSGQAPRPSSDPVPRPPSGSPAGPPPPLPGIRRSSVGSGGPEGSDG